jgi:hypothetical protein
MRGGCTLRRDVPIRLALTLGMERFEVESGAEDPDAVAAINTWLRVWLNAMDPPRHQLEDLTAQLAAQTTALESSVRQFVPADVLGG